MDEIYGGAEVVLTAAAGKDADIGLAGVSTLKRRPQAQCQLGNRRLVGVWPNPEREIMNNSWWSLRGWTYQESVLAKRRLFFTQSGMYFECGQHSQVETVKESFPYNEGMETRFVHTDLHTIDSPMVYKHINAFTMRGLSYPSDSLRAMMGVFHHLERSASIVCHYWGIPILPFPPYADESPRTLKSSDSALAAFVRGLRWAKSGGVRNRPVAPRRLGFPSWSWCGWDNTLTA
jgi:hypothetical protein